jgi:type I restriction enzyme S subunit
VKEDWPTRPLAEICLIKPPKSEARSKLPAHAPVSFVPMEDLAIGKKFLAPVQERKLGEVQGSYTYFADGDVLLAKITPCFENGKLAIATGLTNGIGFGSSEFVVLRPNGAITNEWLYYFLDRPEFRAAGEERMVGAVGHKRVAKEYIESCRIPTPPLPEQHRIVAILDAAWDAIRQAKAHAEANRKNARALLDGHIADVFGRRGPDWKEVPVADVCRLVNGRAYKKSELLRAGKYRLLRVGNFFTNEKWYFSDLELDADKYCDKGDLLYAWSASFGPRIWQGEKVIYHYHIWKVIPDPAVVTKEYLMRVLAWDVDRIKQAHGTGTTMMHVGKGSMDARKIPIPPRAEQASIVARIAALQQQTEQLESVYERKLAALDELKNSLLHAAFTGNL